MSTQELIAKAREFAREFRDLNPAVVQPETFPDVRVRETAMVYFSSATRSDRLEICLDRETGEIVGATYAPPGSQDHTTF